MPASLAKQAISLSQPHERLSRPASKDKKDEMCAPRSMQAHPLVDQATFVVQQEAEHMMQEEEAQPSSHPSHAAPEIEIAQPEQRPDEPSQK